jgi:hypothetical protein
MDRIAKSKQSSVVSGELMVLNAEEAKEKIIWYADEIATTWRSTVKGIIQTAKLIIDAENDAELTDGDRKDLARELKERGIGPATTSKLRQIATCRLFKEEDYKYLPPSYNHLYEISSEKLSPQYQKIIKQLSEGEDFSEIRAKLTRKTGRAAKKGVRQQQCFTLSADMSKISKITTENIKAFILSMKRSGGITVKVTPTWSKHIKEEV